MPGINAAVAGIVLYSLLCTIDSAVMIRSNQDSTLSGLSLDFLSPEPGAIFFEGERIRVEFRVKEFDWVAHPIHVVAYVDDSEDEVTLSQFQFTIDGLAAGDHTIQLVLFNRTSGKIALRKNSMSHSTPIRASVSVSVVAPPAFSTLVPVYADYKELQLGQYSTFESENAHWMRGQQRFLAEVFASFPTTWSVLDIACGDGVGLRVLRDMGFTAVVGVEFNPAKVALARQVGFEVLEADLHAVPLPAASFDAVYSSHTLEHAFWPDKAVRELHRLLQCNATLIVVVPYPELYGSLNDGAHGAKYELGLHVQDNAATLVSFFTSRGFEEQSRTFDAFREPEVWLVLRKRACSGEGLKDKDAEQGEGESWEE
mmetsp:Transcript_23297/g.55448  ORF Transcript_23297/g.55448 Transcript_23297/m.55448 type:complete len:370 (-) Transcript_23297:40-1149(-)